MDLNVAPLLGEYIVSQLKNASILGESVEIYPYHRGIGKSTALVTFAKEFGFTVITPRGYHAKSLKEETGYANIISESDVGGQRIDTRFVYDEGVELYKLEDLKLNLVTGFKKAY